MIQKTSYCRGRASGTIRVYCSKEILARATSLYVGDQKIEPHDSRLPSHYPSRTFSSISSSVTRMSFENAVVLNAVVLNAGRAE